MASSQGGRKATSRLLKSVQDLYSGKPYSLNSVLDSLSGAKLAAPKATPTVVLIIGNGGSGEFLRKCCGREEGSPGERSCFTVLTSDGKASLGGLGSGWQVLEEELGETFTASDKIDGEFDNIGLVTYVRAPWVAGLADAYKDSLIEGMIAKGRGKVKEKLEALKIDAGAGVSKAHFAEVLKHVGSEASEAQVSAAYSALLTGGRSSITADELLSLWEEEKPEGMMDAEERIQKAAGMADVTVMVVEGEGEGTSLREGFMVRRVFQDDQCQDKAHIGMFLNKSSAVSFALQHNQTSISTCQTELELLASSVGERLRADRGKVHVCVAGSPVGVIDGWKALMDCLNNVVDTKSLAPVLDQVVLDVGKTRDTIKAHAKESELTAQINASVEPMLAIARGMLARDPTYTAISKFISALTAQTAPPPLPPSPKETAQAPQTPSADKDPKEEPPASPKQEGPSTSSAKDPLPSPKKDVPPSPKKDTPHTPKREDRTRGDAQQTHASAWFKAPPPPSGTGKIMSLHTPLPPAVSAPSLNALGSIKHLRGPAIADRANKVLEKWAVKKRPKPSLKYPRGAPFKHGRAQRGYEALVEASDAEYGSEEWFKVGKTVVSDWGMRYMGKLAERQWLDACVEADTEPRVGSGMQQQQESDVPLPIGMRGHVLVLGFCLCEFGITLEQHRVTDDEGRTIKTLERPKFALYPVGDTYKWFRGPYLRRSSLTPQAALAHLAQALDHKFRLGEHAIASAKKTDAAGLFGLRDPYVAAFLRENFKPVKVQTLSKADSLREIARLSSAVDQDRERMKLALIDLHSGEEAAKKHEQIMAEAASIRRQQREVVITPRMRKKKEDESKETSDRDEEKTTQFRRACALNMIIHNWQDKHNSAQQAH